MAPARTIMDLSLAQALYFASRGKGSIRDHKSGEMQEYTSKARVILSGLGADELLGGYVRHRNAFKHAGWQGLLDEVRFQFISNRKKICLLRPR
jgi:asparagine synthetase B (glutamine-hydrolysing)